MANLIQKTVWKSAAIPKPVYDDARMLAGIEKDRNMGDILGEILAPVLKQRIKAGLKKNYGVDIQLKRQESQQNGRRK